MITVSETNAAPVNLTSPSTLALMMANIMPMAGVLFLGWNIGDVLLAYWGESVVIGFYTLLKIGVVVRSRILLLGPFLMIHFGFFMLFCLGIILAIEHEVNKLVSGSYQPQVYTEIARHLAPACIAFLVSHGVSFAVNFLGRGEYKQWEVWDRTERWFLAGDMTRELYQRTGPVLGMAMVSAFIVSMFGNSGPLLLIVIAIKIAVDLVTHLREHQRPLPSSQTCTWK